MIDNDISFKETILLVYLLETKIIIIMITSKKLDTSSSNHHINVKNELISFHYKVEYTICRLR